METLIDDLIQPEGWLPWDGEFGIKTCYYAEFNNYGPGANKTGRVKWEGVKTISYEEAKEFTPANFFEGNLWIKPTGVPYIPEFALSNITGYSSNGTEVAAGAPTPTTADPPLGSKVALTSAVVDSPVDNYPVRGQPVEAPWNAVMGQPVVSPSPSS